MTLVFLKSAQTRVKVTRGGEKWVGNKCTI